MILPAYRMLSCIMDPSTLFMLRQSVYIGKGVDWVFFVFFLFFCIKTSDAGHGF